MPQVLDKSFSKIDLQSLSERLRAIERGGDAQRPPAPVLATGWAAVDARLGPPVAGQPALTWSPGGLLTGAVHEWCGLADPQGEPLATWTPPLCLLMHLVRQALRQRAGQAVWIGREAWPYPLALASADRALLERCLFVDVRAAEQATGRGSSTPQGARRPQRRRGERDSRGSAGLWAADLALRCPAVSVVVLDASGLSMAGTRRLQLAAEAGQSLGLLARPPQESIQLSAAQTRWRVQVAPSPRDRPRWRLSLLRAKGAAAAVQAAGDHGDFLLEWSRATTDVVCLSADVAGGPGAASSAQGEVASVGHGRRHVG
jgi:hypothetical protein